MDITLYISTSHCSELNSIIELFAGYVNILEFCVTKDTIGIYQIGKKKTVVLRTNIFVKKLDEFYKKDVNNKLTFSIDSYVLLKVFSSYNMDNIKQITMYMTERYINKLVIEFNNDQIIIPILDINQSNLIMPPITFDCIVYTNINILADIINSDCNDTTHIWIKCNGKKVYYYKNDNTLIKKTGHNNKDGTNIKTNGNKNGIHDIVIKFKNIQPLIGVLLTTYSKDKEIIIYLKNDYPLYIKYNTCLGHNIFASIQMT